jgi:hypothetical protein
MDAITKGEVCVCIILGDQDKHNLNTAMENYQLYQDSFKKKSHVGINFQQTSPNFIRPTDSASNHEKSKWFGQLYKETPETPKHFMNLSDDTTKKPRLDNPMELLGDFITKIKKLCLDLEKVKTNSKTKTTRNLDS